jgi:hypothetical protein
VAIDVFDTAIAGDETDQLIDNVGCETVDLTNFTMTPIGGKEIKKYIFTLFKVRAEMNKMMGVSGTHENDPMFFVDHAKQRVSGGGSVHRLALFFFYVKCIDNPRVDDEFCLGMSDNLKGSSTNTDH